MKFKFYSTHNFLKPLLYLLDTTFGMNFFKVSENIFISTTYFGN